MLVLENNHQLVEDLPHQDLQEKLEFDSYI